MALPPEPEPFFKWDPDGHTARARATTRAEIHEPTTTTTREREIRRRQAVKRWLLRWAWLLSTGVLLFGYFVLAALLTGHGGWFGA